MIIGNSLVTQANHTAEDNIESSGDCMNITVQDEVCFTISTRQEECFFIKYSEDYPEDEDKELEDIDIGDLGFLEIKHIASCGFDRLAVIGKYNPPEEEEPIDIIGLVEYVVGTQNGLDSITSVLMFSPLSDFGIEYDDVEILEEYDEGFNRLLAITSLLETGSTRVIYIDGTFLTHINTVESSGSIEPEELPFLDETHSIHPHYGFYDTGCDGQRLTYEVNGYNFRTLQADILEDRAGAAISYIDSYHEVSGCPLPGIDTPIRAFRSDIIIGRNGKVFKEDEYNLVTHCMDHGVYGCNDPYTKYFVNKELYNERESLGVEVGQYRFHGISYDGNYFVGRLFNNSSYNILNLDENYVREYDIGTDEDKYGLSFTLIKNVLISVDGTTTVRQTLIEEDIIS